MLIKCLLEVGEIEISDELLTSFDINDYEIIYERDIEKGTHKYSIKNKPPKD